MRLAPGDEAQIAGLLARCLARISAGGPRCGRVIMCNWWPAIVGHLEITFRNVSQGNRLIPAIGMAELAKEPEHRGNGIAGLLFGAAITVGRQSPAQLALLFWAAAPYERAGFRTVHNTKRFMDMTGAVTGQVERGMAEGLMVLSLRGKPWVSGTMVDMPGHLF